MRTSTSPISSFVMTVAVLIAGVLQFSVALAQVVPPVPKEQAEAEPPTNRFGMPSQGWVVIRYTVLADGTTADVRTVDRVPALLPDRQARDAVESWTFEPATSDGTAIDWHNNESVIVFRAPVAAAEPSRQSIRVYQEVETLVSEGEIEDALKSSQRLLAGASAPLADIGVVLVQNARVNMMLDDSYAAYESIRRATDPRMDLLAPSELGVALEYRNTLELRLGDVVGALETFRRRQELGPVPDTDLMAASHERLAAALGSDAAIGVRGRILDDAWRHDLKRRTFAIGDLEGSLRRVNVECDRQTTELEYSETAEWTLPESWGSCTAFVEGRGDTEFTFYEFE